MYILTVVVHLSLVCSFAAYKACQQGICVMIWGNSELSSPLASAESYTWAASMALKHTWSQGKLAQAAGFEAVDLWRREGPGGDVPTT